MKSSKKSPAVVYVINKGMPIPPMTRGRPCMYPWYNMLPTDSFFCPGYVNKKGARIMPTLMGKKAHPGSKWTTRQVVENGEAGVRVWRIK